MDNSASVTSCLEWCAGYSGISLGLARVIRNLRVIALGEIEAYACANLVAKMEMELLDPAPVWADIKTFPCAQFHGLVDIFAAGYPCQPFSQAGKRKGSDDPRHLWPFIQRAIAVIRPRFVFFENVEGHITLGLKDVLHDLDELGYSHAAGLFSAAEVGAPHQRKRVAILGMANGDGGREQQSARLIAEKWQRFINDSQGLEDADGLEFGTRTDGRKRETSSRSDSQSPGPSENDLADAGNGQLSQQKRGSERRNGIGSTSADLADAEYSRCERRQPDRSWPETALPPGKNIPPGVGQTDAGRERPQGQFETGTTPRPTGRSNGTTLPEFPPGPGDREQWEQVLAGHPFLAPALTEAEAESIFRGMAHGASNRVDRLRLAGNGVVPATIEKAFLTLLSELL